MAQRVIVEDIDDLDGTPAERTVGIGLDGVSYEIDLSAQNIEKLQGALAGFVACARRVKPSGKARAGTGGGLNRETSVAAREWARNNGYIVSGRGRLPKNVADAFHAAHPVTA
jgi:hypothetical protein